MKKSSLITLSVFIFLVSSFSQKLSVDLTFTAINNTAYIKLDSIKVMNRSQGGETMIYWPDTSLTIEITPGDLLLYAGYSTGYPIGVPEINKEKQQFQLFQNYPNPVKDHGIVTLYLPAKGIVNVTMSDIQGRMVINNDFQFEEGQHSFRLTACHENIYFLTARWKGLVRSIKIAVKVGNCDQNCTLDYLGNNSGESALKITSYVESLIMLESGILDKPETNKFYTFQFATNISCPGSPSVSYEGKVYRTIQIFSQCWLKENLNVGIMIDSNQNMYNNAVIE